MRLERKKNKSCKQNIINVKLTGGLQTQKPLLLDFVVLCFLH